MILNNVNYKGKVHISLRKKGKVFNRTSCNAGTKTLMSLITKALAGYNIQSSVPKYLDLLFQTTVNGVTEYKSILHEKVPLTGIIYDYSPTSIISNEIESNLYLEGIITHDNNVISAEVNVETFKFKLVLKNKNNDILAEVEDDEALRAMVSGLQSGMDGLIDWTMNFSNVSNAQESEPIGE